jgi:hypothetical protein
MFLYRFISVAVLVFWVGGLLALGGIAAPQIFAMLDAQGSAAAGHALAGAVFGAILEQFLKWTSILGFGLLAILLTRAFVGPRPRWLASRMAILTLMLAASLYTGLILAPRIDAIREATPAGMTSLPETDPTRLEFGRLHGLSSGVMLGTLLLGSVLLWMEMRLNEGGTR